MTLPTAPSRTMSQDTFDSTTDAFIGALPQFETDMNALAAAMTLNATTDTSATSNSIGTGAKTFTVSASKSFWPGMWLVIADTAAPTTNAMFVQVTSYSGTTLVIYSYSVIGSGTKTAWSISQSAPATGVYVNSSQLAGVTNLYMTAADTANNKLGVYAASSAGVPDATNYITVAVPTVHGTLAATRTGAHLSGTSQISLADAGNYWSKGSLNAEIKTAWLYAIAPAAGGIVWALGGYSGFTRVPTTTTATDDDYLHLEDSSTYTRAATDYCVCVGRVRYEYDTADTPDHTFQTTVLDAPQIVYNPPSDYTRTLSLAADNTSASDIADYSAVSVVVKQSGKYKICAHVGFILAQVEGVATAKIKTGSATYASATLKAVGSTGLAQYNANAGICTIPMSTSVYLNYGDTIHLGAALAASTGSGNRTVEGDTFGAGYTALTFSRED